MEKLFGSRARAALLRVLFTEGRRKMHLRELSRMTGVAAPNLLREARCLASYGLLIEEKDGNRVFYSANADSPLFASLAELVSNTSSGDVPKQGVVVKANKVPRKRTPKKTLVNGDMLTLAQTLNGLFDQSYAALKPVVDDVCRCPESISENELAHLFDATLDIATDKGKRLFEKLCKTFDSLYPECVRDYIEIEREQYGED